MKKQRLRESNCSHEVEEWGEQAWPHRQKVPEARLWRV